MDVRSERDRDVENGSKFLVSTMGGMELLFIEMRNMEELGSVS